LATLGAQASCCTNDPLRKTSGVWDLSDNVSKTIGGHLLKFGADAMLLRPSTFAANNGRGSFGFTGVFTQNPQSRAGTGNWIADLLLGTANSLTSGRAFSAGRRFKRRCRNISTIRASFRLTHMSSGIPAAISSARLV
jgi:hypothetical protein